MPAPYRLVTRTHELKLWPEFWADVYHGLKAFDIRKRRDRDFQRFDIIVFKEWDPKTEAYTGCEMRALITYVFDPSEDHHWQYVYEDVLILGMKVLIP